MNQDLSRIEAYLRAPGHDGAVIRIGNAEYRLQDGSVLIQEART